MPLVQQTLLISRQKATDINPDEAGEGTSIQGGAGDVKDVLLLDVTPLTLGIETMGVLRHRLSRRTPILPRSLRFSTAEDNQTAVTIHVVQGERKGQHQQVIESV